MSLPIPVFAIDLLLCFEGFRSSSFFFLPVHNFVCVV
ncbi:hypothetical protein NC653_015145 [Populus alba x Populus x berolinensis]|uniref:Uncharacterized protein n=1 Tax=Populus alba x Populus x berolinensis TaxID=444605 RepID=A0AAD6W5W3_9ROSI|nr:hypothetical protein NC653_015145 [Populus alba x Populus x berolinensis]